MAFTEETLGFLSDLAANNNRDWFHANKKRYERDVKLPMLAFSAEMIERMREFDPLITMQPKDALSRINRDTRFSKDKSPYKTNVYMVITSGGKKDFGTPGLYFNLGAEQLFIASGLYMLEPDQLTAVRRHLLANPAELAEQLQNPAFVQHFGEIKGETNKILPAEFKEAAQTIPLLFNKQFFYWSEHPAPTALRPDLADWVTAHIRAAWPMNEFLKRAFV